MHSKGQIKVIKKNDVKFYKTPTVREKSPKSDAAREIATTVSGWVNEFQLRQRETKQTFDCLFA